MIGLKGTEVNKEISPKPSEHVTHFQLSHNQNHYDGLLSAYYGTINRLYCTRQVRSNMFAFHHLLQF